MATLAEAKSRMEDAEQATRREFASVRTGKATPALLDTVRVEAYGSKVPLNQVATVSSPEARLLMVQPFDTNVITEIERGIMQADLGLNPSNDGSVIRVPIPPLTEERREELVRMLHTVAEEGRISVRQARQEANRRIKDGESEHELGEDEAHRRREEVQELTDEYVGRIDQLLEAKEEEVLAG